MDKARRVELGKLKIKRQVNSLKPRRKAWALSEPIEVLKGNLPYRCHCDMCCNLIRNYLVEKILDKEANKDLGLI
jgi:hypothetical protein